MDSKGYYSILGISTNSTNAQIKKAYRNLALKYHPDRNNSPRSAEMMRKINEAYGVLSDKQKRFDYDHNKDAEGYLIEDTYKTYSKYSTGWKYNVKDKENSNSNNKSYSYYYNYNYNDNNDNNAYYNFNNQSKQKEHIGNTVSVWWQMLFSLIPLINLWTFFRIQRLEMAIVSIMPILIGILVLLTVMPGYSFFPLRFEDRFNLFILLFGGVHVFFARRWSMKWNEQIKKGLMPTGDNIDKKVKLITQLMLSIIPFVNFAAFARIYYFQRSLAIGIPNYILMIFVTLAITYNNNPTLFYPVYWALTSTVSLIFMYRWTTRYNAGKYYR